MQGVARQELPVGVGWVMLKGKPLLFLTSNIGNRSRPLAGGRRPHPASPSVHRAVCIVSQGSFRRRLRPGVPRGIRDPRPPQRLDQFRQARRPAGCAVRVQSRGFRRRPADGSAWRASSPSTVMRDSTARSRMTSARPACASRVHCWSMHRGGEVDGGRRQVAEGRGGPEDHARASTTSSPRSGTPIPSRPIASPSRRPTTLTSPRSTAQPSTS